MAKTEQQKEAILRMQNVFKGIWKDIQAGTLDASQIEAKHAQRMEFIEELVEEATEDFELPKPELVIVTNPDGSADVYSERIPYSYVVIVGGETVDAPMLKTRETETFDTFEELLEGILIEEAE